MAKQIKISHQNIPSKLKIKAKRHRQTFEVVRKPIRPQVRGTVYLTYSIYTYPESSVFFSKEFYIIICYPHGFLKKKLICVVELLMFLLQITLHNQRRGFHEPHLP